MGVSLVYPQVASEHKVCVIDIIVSYVAGEYLITPTKAQLCVAHATSLPSSTVTITSVYELLTKQKQPGCKKSVRPTMFSYKQPKSLISRSY